jgi:integrase
MEGEVVTSRWRRKRGTVRRHAKGWQVLVTYTGQDGKRHARTKLFKERAEAEAALSSFVESALSKKEPELESSRAALESSRAESFTPPPRLFNELAAWYRENFLVPPIYQGPLHVGGLRGWRKTRNELAILVREFGTLPLSHITYPFLVTWRDRKLRSFSICTVNRRLALLRRIFNVGRQAGLVEKSPFDRGGLVRTSLEPHRTRILSREEEDILLRVARASRSRSLYAAILLALDGGLRRAEIEKLSAQDIDLTTRTVVVRATNTKTQRERLVGLTTRCMQALEAWCGGRQVEGGGVRQLQGFPSIGTFDASWKRARRKAGLCDVRFHDLRHTCATRLIQAGLPIAEVARILGHTTIQMTYRYVNQSRAPARQSRAPAGRFSRASHHTVL